MSNGTSVGVDVGATTVKAAVVDNATGELSNRIEYETPSPATPCAVATLVAAMVRELAATDPVGITIPGRVRNEVMIEAVNLHFSWKGVNVRSVLGNAIGASVEVLNDADAAGLAEVRFGAARNEPGKVLVLTLGTGIGISLLDFGRLIPGLEIGHVLIDGHRAEHLASAEAMRRNNLTFAQWSVNLNRFIDVAESIFNPDLIVVGGGVTERYELWWELLRTQAPRRVASLRSNAGIIGAAMSAAAESRGDPIPWTG